VSNGFFRKDEFCYDAELDEFICPAGQVLSSRTESKLRDLKKIDCTNRTACLVCPIRSHCTNGYRAVSRLENEAVLDPIATRLKARPEILNRRRETVEHPFGSIEQWMNQGAFLMKGFDNVRGLVQSDRARLKFAAGAQYPRRRSADGGCPGEKEARNWPDRPTWTPIASSQRKSCARRLKHC
jgi:hypothetical protein